MRHKQQRSTHGFAILFLIASATSVAASEPTTGFDCVITPSQTVELGSPVAGQLHEVLVDRSDRVNAGQIVASLDTHLEQAGVAIARLRADADAELNLRKAAFEMDSRSERRVFSLVASKVASAQDHDRASHNANLSAWRVLQAEDDMQEFDLELARAEAALDRRRIRSPIDGVILAKLRNPGEHIDNQPLLRIVKLDPLYVEAILPMRLFGKVKAGMSASVFPELYEGLALKATVDVVDPMGDAGSGTFGARLALPNPQGNIAAGVKCLVQLHTRT
jgi:RND family efflux transporter MFP subunit